MLCPIFHRDLALRSLEETTMYLRDPGGNPIKIKGCRHRWAALKIEHAGESFAA